MIRALRASDHTGWGLTARRFAARTGYGDRRENHDMPCTLSI